MISLVLTVLMLGILAIGLGVRRSSPPVAMGIIVVSLVGIWFSWRPEDLTTIAHAVGVGRGSDLALYLGLSLVFLAIAALMVQLRRMQLRFTRLVREVALMQARSDQQRDENP